jgi:hypothetical protein
VQLKSKTLMPNFALRQAIEAYLPEHGQTAALSAPEHRACGAGGGTSVFFMVCMKHVGI